MKAKTKKAPKAKAAKDVMRMRMPKVGKSIGGDPHMPVGLKKKKGKGKPKQGY